MDFGPALLLIDIQQGFDDPYWGERNNPEAEAKMADLLAHWRSRGLPIFHIQHLSSEPQSPLRPGQPGCEFKPFAVPLPHETVIQKDVNSAFIGTDLEKRLHDASIETLVLIGLTTNHCVSTTARMAGNLGFRTFVIADATAAFGRHDHTGRHYEAELVHQISLASLHGEFATVLDAVGILPA